MRRIMYAQAGTVISSAVLVCFAVLWAQAQAKKQPTPTPTPEKKIQIEDAVERREGNNKVIFKPEFELVKQSNNNAVVRKKSTGTTTKAGTVTGEITCKCTPDDSGKSGSCLLQIKGFTATCTADGGCTCTLILVTK